jgi:hypothetical protein
MLRAVAGGSGGGGAVPTNVPTVLAQGGQVTLTGTLTKTAMATIPIPVLSANSVLEIRTEYEHTANTNQKAYSIQFGASDIVPAFTTNAASSFACSLEYIIANKNGLTSQYNRFKGNQAGSTATFFDNDNRAVNTGVTQSLVIYAQLANVADTITLQSYTVSLLNP